MNPGHIRVQRELIIARDLLIASWVFNALERWNIIARNLAEGLDSIPISRVSTVVPSENRLFGGDVWWPGYGT